jgi:hypothetical protein
LQAYGKKRLSPVCRPTHRLSLKLVYRMLGIQRAFMQYIKQVAGMGFNFW